MAKVIDTYIDINAPPGRVWKVLIDFPAWKDWNPFIPSISGKPEVGASLHLTVSPPGLRSMEFKSKVFAVRSGEEITWGGGFLLFVFRSDHTITLTPTPGGGTRFRQIERWQGPMVFIMSRMFNQMFKPTEQGYHQMNEALKRRVEGDSKS